ncbi:hypothetical protein GTY56_18015 [Streptomyces sp. SID5643]|nr:hypothetical protein [Streptomyces sp. SID5643]
MRGIPRQSEGEADALTPQPGNGTSVRDPWQEQEDAGAEPSGDAPDAPDADGQTHDPHEVTVQLDAVQLGDGFLRQVKEGPGAEAAADRPVFVDESGRRSRRYRRIGMAVALACGAYAVVIVATLLSGNSNAPWLPVPAKDDSPPAGQVDTPSLPAESAPTTGTGTGTGTGATAPGSTPATGRPTAPGPGLSAAVPGTTAGTGRSGASAEPTPSATRTVPAPGGKATAPAPTKPADPPSTPAIDPTPTAEPTATPTETTGAGGDGGTVAEGPAEPQPVAEGPAEPQPVAETPAAA